MVSRKIKIAAFCDRGAVVALYGLAFYLPISKGLLETFLALAMVFFAIKKILLKEDIPLNLLNACVLAYLAATLASALYTTNYAISAKAFLGKVFKRAVLFFIVPDILNSRKRLRNLLYVFLFSSLIFGCDGIFQYFTHHDFIRGRQYVGKDRIHANFPSPNDFACYLYMMIPFVIAALYTIKQPRKLHIGIFGLLLLLFVCLMLTISRGGWFSFISSLLFMSIWLKALGAVIIILVISIIFTREMYYDYLKERLNSFFSFLDGSSIDRNRIWEAAWKMFLARPLLGLGLGTFMFNFPFFISAGYKYTTPYAHNCYLQMAAETGVFGLLSFMTLVAVFLTFGIDALNTSRRDFSWYILLASLAAAIGYLVQMTVDTIFYSLDLGILFWLVLGIGISAMRLCEHSTPAQKTSS